MSERMRTTTTAEVCMGGAGCADVFAFDPAAQLLALENKKGETPFATFAYHYDANGNRDKITDNDGEHTYTCDSAVHPVSIAKEKREAIIRKFKTIRYLSLYFVVILCNYAISLKRKDIIRFIVKVIGK